MHCQLSLSIHDCANVARKLESKIPSRYEYVSEWLIPSPKEIALGVPGMHSGTSAAVIVLLDCIAVRDEAYVWTRTLSEAIRYQYDENQERWVEFHDNTLYKLLYIYVAAQRSR